MIDEACVKSGAILSQDSVWYNSLPGMTFGWPAVQVTILGIVAAQAGETNPP